jgi:hypothetical protein
VGPIEFQSSGIAGPEVLAKGNRWSCAARPNRPLEFHAINKKHSFSGVSCQPPDGGSASLTLRSRASGFACPEASAEGIRWPVHSPLSAAKGKRSTPEAKQRGQRPEPCAQLFLNNKKHSFSGVSYLSGRADLNRWPHGPEPCALSGLSYAPQVTIIPPYG